MNRMKIVIIVKKIILCILVSFLGYWLGSVIDCEIKTNKLKTEFEQIIYDEMELDKNGRFKVLYFDNNYARVYYANDNIGNLYGFIKNGDKWNMYGLMHTVWSRSGNADGFLWPYGR